MRNAGQVLVIGAGVGGLAAAAAFAARGARVEVVERRPEGQVLGVGINQPANALRALRTLGVLDEILASGFAYDRLQFHDRDGRLVVEVPSSLGGDVPANCAVSRAALSDALAGAARRAGGEIRYGTRPERLHPQDDGVYVVFNDGRSARYDLVLAFDGMHSRTRRLLFGGHHDPQFTGCAVWRVTVPRPASVTCCQLFHGIDTKAGLIPISRDRMYLFLVSREPGNPQHDPARFVELLKGRLAEHGGIVGQIRDGLGTRDGIVYSPLHEVTLPAPWHKGRVVVAGDAAHLGAPHLTQGAAMALEDAVILAELFDREAEVEATLDEFTARRLPRTMLVQDVSRRILTAEMSVTPDTFQASLVELRDQLPARLRKVEAILNQPA